MTMADGKDYILPVWAYRLRKAEIERLYTSCADGHIDGELIDSVGAALHARCVSMLKVAEAIRGRPLCPVCGTACPIEWRKDAIAECPECGWSCPFALYKKTYQRKGLFAGGMESFVREFVKKFAASKSPRERLILIDSLIHRFHWESGEHAGGRPGATSLIEGKMTDVTAFLDRLTYGDNVPPEIAGTREAWRRKWRGNAWSKGKGQRAGGTDTDRS